jgi:DEAD/DEAH box helicase
MTSTQSTMQQLQRALAGLNANVGLAAFRGDPAAFARACGVTLDDWQTAVLQSDAKRIAILASRQSGKTLCAAVLALYQCVYHAGSLVLIVSPTLKQSQESFQQVRDLLNGLALTSELHVPADGESALSLRLSNRSRIVALCGKERSTRGYSNVSLLVVDEASRVEDAFYFSMRPTLAVSNGKLVTLSTPWGTRGWWYEGIWRGHEDAPDGVGDDGWLRVKRPAELCPRISADFLAEERRALGSWWADQEYGCIFRQAIDRVFSDEVIANMFAEDYETWQLDVPGDRPDRQPGASTPGVAATRASTDDWQWDLSGGSGSASTPSAAPMPAASGVHVWEISPLTMSPGAQRLSAGMRRTSTPGW